MVRYICGICNREFSSPSGLTQHSNAKHCERITLSQPNEFTQRSQQFQQLPRTGRMSRPEHDETLWNMPITMVAASSSNTTSKPNLPTLAENAQVSDDEMEDIIFEDEENEPHYNLRSRMQNIEPEKMEESSEKPETDLQLPVYIDIIDVDSEDLRGASLDDALDTIEGKNVTEHVAKWPSDAYRDFMNLIVEGNISNKIGDKIIKTFNKHSNLEKSPFPSSTKHGKDYLNQINSPLVDFKEKVVATYNEVNFTLYYHPIFHAIQALLQQPEVTNNFVHKGILKKVKASFNNLMPAMIK